MLLQTEERDLSKINSNSRKKTMFFNLDLYKSAYQVAVGSFSG